MSKTEIYADNKMTTSTQEAENVVKAPESIMSNWTSLVPMVLIFVVFYFFLIRPQDKRRKEQQLLINGVKKGEEIVTNSGIFGIVTKIHDNDHMLEIEIAKDVQIKILKSAIADIVSRKKEMLQDKKIKV
jgi:preprotein translocase subunit YajC